jgi:predicted metal-dependent HD superfamily phosphohydrolase
MASKRPGTLAAWPRSRRQAILEGFLRRPVLFSTAFFRERLEAPARANLQRSIARLQAGSGDAPA